MSNYKQSLSPFVSDTTSFGLAWVSNLDTKGLAYQMTSAWVAWEGESEATWTRKTQGLEGVKGEVRSRL
jgi:hypothetical protein